MSDQRFSIDIEGDPSSAVEAFQKVRAEADKTEAAVSKFGQKFEKASSGLLLPSGAKSSFNQAAKGLDEVGASADRASKKVKELRKERKEFLDTGGGVLVPVSSLEGGKLAPNLTQIAKELRKVRGEAKLLQEELGHTAAAEGIAKLRIQAEALSRHAGIAFQGFPEAGEKAAQSLTRVSRATQAADNFLGKFGLNTRQVSILLGAGLAGGVTFVLRELLRFTDAIIKSAQEIDEFQHDADQLFGRASSSVKDFANNTDQAMGLTRSEVLETANAFGLLAEKMELPKAAAARFATAFTAVAKAVLDTRPGFASIAEVQKSIESAVEGSNDALLALGVSIAQLTETAQKDFGKLPDQLTPAEREFVVLSLLAQNAEETVSKTGEKMLSVGGRVKNFFSGKDFANGFNAIRDAVNEINLEKLEKSVAKGEGFRLRSTNLRNLTVEFLRGLREEAEGHEDLIAIIDKEIERREKLAAARKKAADESLSALEIEKRNEEAFLRSTSAVRSAEDAFRNLGRAREDAARNIATAERALERVREDNTHKEEELRLRSARAAEDAAIKIRRAEENITSAKELAVIRLKDAEEAIAKARQTAFRANRAAQERIEDFERNSARRIFDLKLRVKRARQDEVKDISASLFSLEQALFAQDALAERAALQELSRLKNDKSGKEQLQDAERELARAEADRIREGKRLRRDAEETRLDGIAALIKAERDLARTQLETQKEVREAERQLEDARRDAQRASEDALRALNRLEVENNRALFDAMKGIRDAEREAKRAVDDLNLSIGRMAKDLGIAVDRLKELIDQLKFSQTIGLLSGGFPLLAGGGAAEKGRLHIVGEQGPELFIPNSSGTVVSNSDLAKLFARMNREQSGRPIVVHEAADPEATAFAVSSRLARGINN